MTEAGGTVIAGTVSAEAAVQGGVAAESAVRGAVTAGPVILNDFVLTVEAMDGGSRLVIRRGSEVQTLDILNGRDSFASVQDDGEGNVQIN